MGEWYPRDEWTSTPAGCVNAFHPGDVRGVAIHYPGGNIPSEVAAGKKNATAAYLRGVRSSQMSSTVYDYCDIEYNIAVDRAGNVWTLRGLQKRGGANGTSASNAAYPSIFVIVGLTRDAKPTRAQKRAIRRVVARVRKVYPGANAIKPHSAFKATACPGVPLHKLIESGALDPRITRLRRLKASLTESIKKLRARLSKKTARRDEVKDKLS